MKIYIEFAWTVAEKIGKKYLWVKVGDGEVEVKDIFYKILPQLIGKELSETLYNLFLNKEVVIIVNGVLVVDPSTKLNDGDKILIQPLASGG